MGNSSRNISFSCYQTQSTAKFDTAVELIRGLLGLYDIDGSDCIVFQFASVNKVIICDSPVATQEKKKEKKKEKERERERD